MTSSWFFLSTLNYDARWTSHQIMEYSVLSTNIKYVVWGFDGSDMCLIGVLFISLPTYQISWGVLWFSSVPRGKGKDISLNHVTAVHVTSISPACSLPHCQSRYTVRAGDSLFHYKGHLMTVLWSDSGTWMEPEISQPFEKSHLVICKMQYRL